MRRARPRFCRNHPTVNLAVAACAFGTLAFPEPWERIWLDYFQGAGVFRSRPGMSPQSKKWCLSAIVRQKAQ
jgi:hypothetical protein